MLVLTDQTHGAERGAAGTNHADDERFGEACYCDLYEGVVVEYRREGILAAFLQHCFPAEGLHYRCFDYPEEAAVARPVTHQPDEAAFLDHLPAVSFDCLPLALVERHFYF